MVANNWDGRPVVREVEKVLVDVGKIGTRMRWNAQYDSLSSIRSKFPETHPFNH